MSDDVPEPAERVQSVRNAWQNALRAEVLRLDRPEMARVATIGVWIASYADADGGRSYPSRETLAALAGCSQEAVTRAVRVLVAVGILARRRRPNSTAVYQLLMPPGPLDWTPHLDQYGKTRQRAAHIRKKEKDAAEAEAAAARTASVDVVRTASTVNVPDSDYAGGSEPPAEGPDSVHGRPRTASVDAVRTASTDAPTSTYLPTVGTPSADTTWFGPEHQPPVARASPPRALAAAPPPAAAAAQPEPPVPGAVQAAFLVSVPTSGPPPAAADRPGRCPSCNGRLDGPIHARCLQPARTNTA